MNKERPKENSIYISLVKILNLHTLMKLHILEVSNSKKSPKVCGSITRKDFVMRFVVNSRTKWIMFLEFCLWFQNFITSCWNITFKKIDFVGVSYNWDFELLHTVLKKSYFSWKYYYSNIIFVLILTNYIIYIRYI